ncbi:MAG TPA: hypothetical protein VMU29_04720 [Smithella sp.]|nr:hypothetical protein [Smithella sp.]
MSSGPGILQRKILEHLKSTDRIFYNQLLWKIAFERNEIKEEPPLSPHIEKGIIKKSFKENFRRSIQNLKEKEIINIEKRKLTDIDEAFEYFPYHTERLEIHQLRKALLPVVKEYIENEKPQKFGDAKIEEEIIAHIEKTPACHALKTAWNKIEKKIIAILDPEAPLHDTWIQILIRGRYLFASDSIPYRASFVRLYRFLNKNINNTMDRENEALTYIRALITKAFDNNMWKIGKAKSVYYDFANMKQFSKDSLKDNIREYLLDKSGDIVTSLPGYKNHNQSSDHELSWHFHDPIQYSDYMDQIITRQILKNQKIIVLKSPIS